MLGKRKIVYGQITETFSYRYDLNGNRETFKLFRNSTSVTEINLHYTYDDLNRLQAALRKDGPSGIIIAEYDYDINGNRTALRYPQNSLETGYSYNYANLVTTLENKKNENGTKVSAWDYTYNLDGNCASKINRTSGVSTTTYQYDRIGRLTQESDPDWNTIAYEYDRYANRSKMTVSGAQNYVAAYEYQPNNWLVKEIKTQGQITETFSYRYDSNGNQIYREWEKKAPATAEPGQLGFTREDSAPKPAILELREYNGFNQLVQVNRPPMSTTYLYRPDGLRHSKAQANPLSGDAIHNTVHYWDGQNIVMESLDGVSNGKYLRGLNLVAQQTDKSLFYYLFNIHGDVVQRVGDDGSVSAMYEYDAFGNEKNPVETDQNLFRYCAEYMDLETKTYYLRARNYDPRTSRFFSEDPAKSGLNWYTYCGNDPVNHWDPSGMATTQTSSSDVALRSYVTSNYSNAKVSYSSATKTVTVIVNGKPATFKVTASNTKNGILYVSPSEITSKLGPRNSEVFLGTHFVYPNGSVPTPAHHSAIVILVDPNGPYKNDPRFKQTVTRNGLEWRFTTLAAGPGISDKEHNYQDPNKLYANVYRGDDVGTVMGTSPGAYMRELDASATDVTNLLSSDEYFKNHNNGTFAYPNIAGNNTGLTITGYNSNSYVHGLLDSAGVRPPTFYGWFPSWDNAIPAPYYGEYYRAQ